MLVNYIGADKLPRLVVWLDWNFYAYWPSLLVCLVLMAGHSFWDHSGFRTTPDTAMIIFQGLCLWTVWCAVRYGNGIG